MSDSPAEAQTVPASPNRLRALAERGDLSCEGFRRALNLLEPSYLGPAVTRHATWFALALLVSGVIFFVAANWSALGFYFRISLVALAMVSSCLYGIHRGLETLHGRAAALSGGLLFGPVMAIYGQHFQTGADSHGLFITWTVVMTVFALGTRFVGAWLSVWVLAHVSVLAWMEQMRGIELFDEEGAGLALGLALANLAVALTTELANDSRQRRRRPPLFDSRARSRWLVNAGLFGFFAPATALACSMILKSGPSAEEQFGLLGLLLGGGSSPSGTAIQLGALTFVLVTPGMIWLYLRRWADIVALSFALFSSSIVTTAALYTWLLEGLAIDGSFWLLGIAICLQMWLLAKISIRARASQIYLAARNIERHDPTESAPASAYTRSTQPTMAGIWQQLAEEDLVKPVGSESPQPLRAALGLATDTAPAFLTNLLTVFGTWVGAILINIFLLGVVEIQDMPGVAAITGGILFAIAVVASRRFQGIASSQLVWICGVSAQLLLVAAAYRAWGHGYGEAIYALMLSTLQLFAVALVRQKSYQIVSLIALAGHSCWFIAEAYLRPSYAFEVMVIVMYLLLVWIWWRDDPTKPQRSTVWGLGLPIAALIPLLGSGQRAWFDGSSSAGPHAWAPPTPWVTDLVLAVGFSVLWLCILVAIARAQGGLGARHRGVLAGTALASFGLGVTMPGLMAGMILASLGLWRRSLHLLVLAYLHLGGFLALYYYELAIPLLGKSVVVLVTAAVALSLARASNTAKPSQPLRPRLNISLQLTELRRLAWGLGLALLLPTVAIVDKELLLARGQPMLLKLRPVDPRSLIQGDYMRLEYELTTFASLPNFALEDRSSTKTQLVVKLDDEGVAQWVSSIRDQELGPGERLLAYRIRDSKATPRLGAESFFFEEGQAATYEKARYAELVVDEDGQSVLVGLRDSERRRLGQPLHKLPEWVPGVASSHD